MTSIHLFLTDSKDYEDISIKAPKLRVRAQWNLIPRSSEHISFKNTFCPAMGPPLIT